MMEVTEDGGWREEDGIGKFFVLLGWAFWGFYTGRFDNLCVNGNISISGAHGKDGRKEDERMKG